MHENFYGGAKNVSITTKSISSVFWECSVGNLLGYRLLNSAKGLNISSLTQLEECQTLPIERL
jgi:hypothetical protein